MQASTKPGNSQAGPESPLSFEPSPRIRSIREQILAEPYSICLERPELLFRFSLSRQARRARKEHPLVRRALALAYIMRNRRPRIHENELIAGNMTSKRLAANYYPEGGSVNILEDLFRLENRPVSIHLTPREKARLAFLGAWGMSKNIAARALLRPGRFNHFLDFFRARRYFVTEEAGIGHQVLDYGMVIRQGLAHPLEWSRKRLVQGVMEDGSPLTPDQKAFYQSVVIVVEAIRDMAKNLAGEARRQANLGAPSARRKRELLSMAENLDRVPLHSALTFAQALQACWMVHLAMNLEDYEQGVSFGRLDQYLQPLWEQDLAIARLDREGAKELLASFMLKTAETLPLYSERMDRYFAGNGVAQGITIGGSDHHGADQTNEVSSLILEAYAQVRLREPALHARIHPKSPDWFWDQCATLVQAGCAKPSFFNDSVIAPNLERAGIAPEHAADYGVIGCVEMASQGRTYNSGDAALFNIPICLEMALNQGSQFDGRKLGASTAPVNTMKSMDDILAAYRIQVKHSVDDMVRVISWLEKTYRILRPTPVNSMCTQGCLEKGMDVTWGGALYDFTSAQGVGLADVGDSLCVLDRLVFREKRLPLSGFVDILRADFAGHEALRNEILSRIPRYGNGNQEADRWVQAAADVFTQVVSAHTNTRGGKYLAGFYSMTCHDRYGQLTGALPNGRLSGQRFANGMAPTDGMDQSGPTGLLASAARLDKSQWANCAALNIKFNHALVQGEHGRRMLSGLLKSYFDMGGMQVQVNVLDPKVLEAARMQPLEHKSLVVRVAGYCAHFVDLRPSTQEEIIQRSSHRLP
ncbi:MAG: hypothetical protein KKA60_06730 [Proteobacteria bacterium]|nr:hypothetical protein [Pseudomonadota bacterium]